MTMEQFFEHAFRAVGLPTPHEVLEARETVKEIFPDPTHRLAFVLSMLDDCTDELNTTPEKILKEWAEGRLMML